MLEVKIGNHVFKNPFILASGVSGYGLTLSKIFDFSKIGGLVLKSLTLKPQIGNPPSRLYDLGFGLINSVGLENEGLEYFRKKILPHIRDLKNRYPNLKIISNIAGFSQDEYFKIIEQLNTEHIIDIFEINISCPNIRKEYNWLVKDIDLFYKFCRILKDISNKDIWLKVSPVFYNLEEVIEVLDEIGFSAVVVSNTLPAVVVDVDNIEFFLGNKIGGYSGEGIKPYVMFLVYKLHKKFKIPIVASGGVNDYKDILAYLMLGASAVEVGTLLLKSPYKIFNFENKVKLFLKNKGFENVREIVGILS